MKNKINLTKAKNVIYLVRHKIVRFNSLIVSNLVVNSWYIKDKRFLELGELRQ